jgi:hypothetical protein
MWHRLGSATLAALLVTSAIAKAQPATFGFDRNGNGGRKAAADGTTVFHGAYGPTGTTVVPAGGTTVVPAGGTTVFHGAPGGYGPPSATGPGAAPPLPSAAGR